jgi:SH3-like domain-containing protein
MDVLFLISQFLLVAAIQSKGLCVTEDFANLRKGPGTQFDKTIVVNKFTPLSAVSKQGRWFEVKDFEGKLHWVRDDVVKTGKRCAIVKEEFAYLRQGPGKDFAKRPFAAPMYLAFEVLGDRGPWLRVKDPEGDIAWIAKHLVWIR